MLNKIGLLTGLCLASTQLMAANGFYPYAAEGKALQHWCIGLLQQPIE